MPMIPDQHVRRNSDVGTTLRECHQLQEVFVISRALKQQTFVVATIDDVMHGTGGQKTQRTGHRTPPSTTSSNAWAMHSPCGLTPIAAIHQLIRFAGTAANPNVKVPGPYTIAGRD